jgi:hypothetical protein
MDPAATTADAPAIGNIPKKQPKARKMAKYMTPDKRKIESKKRASRRKADKNCMLATRLDKERRQDTKRYLAAQALANSEELAGKAAVRGLDADEAGGAQRRVRRRHRHASSPPCGGRVVDQLSHVDTERAASP